MIHKGREALLTIQSGPLGAQLVLIDADPRQNSKLRIAASGEPIGIANRWMSPITNGQQILSVHTPHIGGVLHQYQVEGDKLIARRLLNQVSNHLLGSRLLNSALWIDNVVWLADQSGQSLHRIDAKQDWRITQTLSFPEGVLATAQIGTTNRIAILLKTGRLSWVLSLAE